jgi:hypothetical protein
MEIENRIVVTEVKRDVLVLDQPEELVALRKLIGPMNNDDMKAASKGRLTTDDCDQLYTIFYKAGIALGK